MPLLPDEFHGALIGALILLAGALLLWLPLYSPT